MDMRWGAMIAVALTLQSGRAVAADDEAAPDPQAAALKAEKDQIALEQDKANLETTKIKNAADKQALSTSKATAITAAFPDAPTKGEAGLNPGAGQLEADILSAHALNAIAAHIAMEVRALVSVDPEPLVPDPNCKDYLPALAPPDAGKPAPIAIFSGSQPVDFSAYALFRFKACKLAREYEKALENVSDARLEFLSTGIGAGTAVSVASKLIQLVTPDWQLTGVTVSYDDRALAAALARAYLATNAETAVDPVTSKPITPSTPRRPLIWPNRVGVIGGSNKVFAALSALDEKDLRAQAALTPISASQNDIAKKIADLKKIKNPTADEKKRIEDQEGQLEKLSKKAAPIEAAIAAYSALLSNMDSGSDKATLPLDRVVQQAALDQALGPRGLALLLSVDKAGGAIASRRVIWNAFGGMPYFVSGGAVVDFAVIRPSDQAVLAAGLLSCHAGFMRIDRVPGSVNGPLPPALACPAK